jgi:hypothetical protein
MSIPKGTKVKMSEEMKYRLRENGSEEHIVEFGECEGIVEGLVSWDENSDTPPGPEVNVRWQPSGLKYAYHPDDLQVL